MAGRSGRSVEQRASRLVAWLAVVVLPLVVVGPWLGPWDTLGFHDWDAMASHRELVRKSLVDYGELPLWNPYACGGFPAWGYIEGATTLVSPTLVFYLAAPMAVAIRLEVLFYAWLGAAGTYRAAARLTRSDAARVLVVALFAVNGRWGLQTAAGHAWHLAYALTPWCFWAFDRAQASAGDRRRSGVGAHAILAGTLAMLVYAGGIYPLPHTVLLLGVYAIAMALVERSLRPLASLAASGVAAVGLAAPKLLPMLGTFARAPRAIESLERYDAVALWAALTSRQQGFFDRPAPIRPYGWHEWGIYIGAAGVIAVVVGAIASLALLRDRRAAALAVAGVVLFALGLGSFAPWAPWTFVHARVPIFGSMHVPSRFLHPAVLALALAAAPGLGALAALLRRRARRAWIAPLLAAFAAGIGLDVALVARKPMGQAMWMRPPAGIEPRAFRHALDPPYAYRRPDWAGPMYLAMLGNVGVLRCYGTPPFEPRGAVVASTDEGLVSLAPREGSASRGGDARVVRWSPNAIDVDVRGAPAGAALVYDMNADAGWRAIVEDPPLITDHDTHDLGGRVAVAVPEGDSQVTLRYVPRGLRAGLALFVATAVALALLGVRERRATA